MKLIIDGTLVQGGVMVLVVIGVTWRWTFNDAIMSMRMLFLVIIVTLAA